MCDIERQGAAANCATAVVQSGSPIEIRCSEQERAFDQPDVELSIRHRGAIVLAMDTKMTSLLAILALGFMLGMRHATDPDHVVAVTTIVSGHRSVKRAALIGAAWGIGHTLTILLVGSGIILFKWVIPARVGLAMELAVAVMLILLGAANLTGTLRWLRRAVRDASRSGALASARPRRLRPHASARSRAGVASPCVRTRRLWRESIARLGSVGSYRLARPLIVGIVHGLAGSAAVALLVLAAITTPLWSVAYLLIFGIGTIAGMMIITAAISVPFAWAARDNSRDCSAALRVASGVDQPRLRPRRRLSDRDRGAACSGGGPLDATIIATWQHSRRSLGDDARPSSPRPQRQQVHHALQGDSVLALVCLIPRITSAQEKPGKAAVISIQPINAMLTVYAGEAELAMSRSATIGVGATYWSPDVIDGDFNYLSGDVKVRYYPEGRRFRDSRLAAASG